MKPLRTIASVVVAAAAFMGFASNATATTVTSPPSTTFTGHIEAATELGHVILHASNGVTIECQGFVTGSLTSHGASVTASGAISHLTFPSCTGADVVSVIAAGTLEAHAIGSGQATLTSSGATITATDGATGISCEYTTSGTHIGVVTPAPTATGHAILDIKSASIPRTGDSILCGGSATWTGSYRITTPTGLTFD